MKKTYQTPEADLKVFSQTESLAIMWEDLNGGSFGNVSSDAAKESGGDIKINIGQ
ncbi:MAG: hypothetical protein IJO56_02930 [Oscillospiraceae bacterium]|nr:hypothetical protein [Oscillospiraceae bacterium]